MAREFAEQFMFDMLERVMMNSTVEDQPIKHRLMETHTSADKDNCSCHICQMTTTNVAAQSATYNSTVAHGKSKTLPAVNGVQDNCKQSNGDSHHSKQIVASHGDGALEAAHCYSPGVMHHMKKKLSNNIGHYSNVLQDIALPILFRRNRKARSRSRSRSKSQDKNHHKDRNHGREQIKRSEDDRLSDQEDYVFVEDIELHDMNGYLVGSKKEVGRGHTFVTVQLKSSTWCDKCGDFIWGNFKQCLECKCESLKLLFVHVLF